MAAQQQKQLEMQAKALEHQQQQQKITMQQVVITPPPMAHLILLNHFHAPLLPMVLIPVKYCPYITLQLVSSVGI